MPKKWTKMSLPILDQPWLSIYAYNLNAVSFVITFGSCCQAWYTACLSKFSHFHDSNETLPISGILCSLGVSHSLEYKQIECLQTIHQPVISRDHYGPLYNYLILALKQYSNRRLHHFWFSSEYSSAVQILNYFVFYTNIIFIYNVNVHIYVFLHENKQNIFGFIGEKNIDERRVGGSINFVYSVYC